MNPKSLLPTAYQGDRQKLHNLKDVYKLLTIYGLWVLHSENSRARSHEKRGFMRVVLVAVLALMMSGCMTAIPMQYEEYCSLDGLTFDRVTRGSDNGVAFINGTAINTFSNSQNVTCAKPKNEQDFCEVKKYQGTAFLKATHNQNVFNHNMVLGFGYAVYVVPGILAYNRFKDQEKETLAQIANESKQKTCPVTP